MRARVAVLAGLATLAAAAPASAATWTVTGAGDEPSGCNALTFVCPSLRAAIAASESNPGADTINVPAGEVRINNDLVIASEITIVGKGARTTIVNGSGKYRGFRIAVGGNASISHLTVTDGAAGQGGSNDGGGILNQGSASLDYVRVTRSAAASGGGIANYRGTLVVQHSLIDNNTGSSVAGVANIGGPEPNQRGQLAIADSTVFKNIAGTGGVGGISSHGGQSNIMLLHRVTVADNVGGVRGAGGVHVESGVWQALANVVARNLMSDASSNCTGNPATLAGANVETEKECGFELQGANPQLATALSNQGGETDVLTIGATSAARDLTPPGSACGSMTDQRGLGRPQGSGCDSGAFEIDAPPTVVITAGPSGSVATPDVQFQFSSTEPGVTYECQLTGPGQSGGFQSCTSPRNYTGLANGNYTFSVRALDGTFGNPTPATRSFTVAALDTTITGGPSGLTNDNTPTFTFSGVNGAAGFQCRVDNAAFTACSSPHTTAALSDGAHTFQVRALSASGAPDPTPASRSFTVDATPPNTTITTGPSGTVGSTTATFTYTSTEAGSTFQCSLDGAAFGNCPTSYTGLSQGSHTFRVRATDPAGNQDPSPAERTWIVDTEAPDPPVIQTPDPGKILNVTDVAFSGTAEPNSTVRVTDGTRTGVAPANGAGSWTVTVAGIPDGTHTFTATATDAVGNTSSGTSRTITVDVAPPETTITSGPTNPTNNASPAFSFASNEPGSTFECRLDDDDFAPCSSPHTLGPLAEGEHRFEVRTIDPAHNPDPTPAILTFVVDLTPPAEPEVDAGPAGVTSDPSPSFTFKGAPGVTFECRLDGPQGPGSFGPCTSPVTFSGLAPGAYVFLLRATDAAGNRSVTRREFTVTGVQAAQVPTPQPPPPTGAPAPEPGKTVVGKLVRGKILVKRKGTKRFVALDPSQPIPLGLRSTRARARSS
jgi:hypothetical protein